MYVIEVIPLCRGTPFERLSYFSKTPYERGALLSIPIRNHSSQGVVLSSQEVSLAKAALRGAPFLLRKLPAQPETRLLPSALLYTADELSEYYAAEQGSVLFALLPGEVKNGEKRIPGASQDSLRTFVRNETKDPMSGQHRYGEKRIPGASQEVVETFDRRKKVSYNLNSSCKETSQHTNEVLQAPMDARILAYQRIIQTSFAEGFSVLLVVPTVEDGEFLASLFETEIPQRVCLLHSGLGMPKLRFAYASIQQNSHPMLIVATPKSAFLTRDDVGTVILERSRSLAYRSRSRPYIDFRYALAVHARHKGQRLITADTLIRTEDECLLREHRALPFEGRHQERLALPGALKIIKMRNKNDEQDFRLFSDTLLKAIEKNREERRRTFLFCARRGLAPVVACADCGMILRCPESGSPLSLHRIVRDGAEERWLVSSISGFKRKANDLCFGCGSWRLRPQGIGIQHIYDDLLQYFADTDLFLFDHQSASTHKKASEIRDAFYQKKDGILLGTALALPYLHDSVDMSAVVNIDALRAIPSWRQQEESLGILLALREKTNGYVFIQTRADDDDIIRYAQDGAIGAYYTDELSARQSFNYPPYSTFIHLTWKKAVLDTLTKEIADRFEQFNITLYGAPAAEERIGYGLIRVKSGQWPQDALARALRSLPPSVRIIINPDRII